jgi:hypothetical protein
VNGLSSDGAPRTISLSEEVFYLGFGAPLGADGIFEIHGVPSGAYQLQWRSDGLTFTKVVTIRNADLNGVELDTPRLREVPIDVSVDNGNPVPKFSLRLNGLTTVSIAGSTGSDFSLQKKLPEGAYKIDIPSLPSGYTVKSFTYGGTDLLRNPIHVSAEDLAGMRINFATRLDPPVKVAGTILGFVSLTPTPKISIGSAIQTIETFINADGSFEFPRVFPGRNNLYLSMPDVTADVPGGSVTINVPATGLTGLKLIMVPIRLKVEGSQAPKTLLVGASRKDGVLPSSTSGTRADGSRWILLTQGEQEIDAAYAVVRSVRYGGVEIGNRLTISAKDPISELSITIGFRP